MGKIVRGILYALGLLLGLVTILAIAIPMFVNPNDYRDEIAALVEKKSGRALNIEGEIELSLFPWIGLELGHMSLSNAAGFGDSPFAKIEQAEVKIKLAPLLRKQVEMDTIILRGMTLNLAKNPKGISNWDDLAKPSPTRKVPTSQPTATPKEPAPAKMLAALAIGGLEINDANILWDDQSQQQKFEINHFNLTSGAISLDSEFPLEVDFSTTIDLGAKTPKMTGELSLKSMIGINLEQQQYHLHQLQLNTNLKSPLLPNGQLNSEIEGDFSADLAKQTVHTKGLTIKTMGAIVSLNSDVTHINKNPVVKGKIDIKIAQASSIMKLLGDALPKTITDKMLESTRLSSDFGLNSASQKMTLEKFLLKFDQTSLKGTASVANFDKPAIRYQFDIDNINLDRYSPPAKKEQKSVTTAGKSNSTAAANDEPLPIPLALLRGLNIDGSLRLGALQVMNLHASKMVTTMKAKGGIVTLAPLSAELYQGKFEGTVKLDARKAVPTIKVEEKLTNVQAGPLLKDLLGKDHVTGKALMSANITTKGDRLSQFKKALNGKVKIRFEDGAVNGIDIAKLIRDAYGRYKKEPAEKTGEKPKTDFALLSATINIKNGVATNNDLTAQSPLLRISGNGQADLVTEKVDYRVKASVVGTLEGQGGKALAELKGLTIPLAIKGSFSDPKYSVDLAQLINEKTKAKVDAAKQKARQEIQRKIDDKKEDLKKKLLNKFKLKF